MSSQFSERHKLLLLYFKDAISREQGAQDLYGKMADSCEDPELKRVLEGFQLDEKRHETTLLERYKVLRGSSDFSD